MGAVVSVAGTNLRRECSSMWYVPMMTRFLPIRSTTSLRLSRLLTDASFPTGQHGQPRRSFILVATARTMLCCCCYGKAKASSMQTRGRWRRKSEFSYVSFGGQSYWFCTTTPARYLYASLTTRRGSMEREYYVAITTVLVIRKTLRHHQQSPRADAIRTTYVRTYVQYS